MYSTTVYLYQQIQRVILVDTSGAYFNIRYNPVYAKKLTVNKGVDNVILFEFVNQDQKPVNVTGTVFTFRLLSQDGLEVLVAKQMEAIAPQLGRVKVTLLAADTDNIVAQPASYSIERSSGILNQAVYVNADSQARADCDIMDSVFPEFVPSAVLTIPTVNIGTDYPEAQITPGWPDWAQTSNAPYYNQLQQTEYYSSFFTTQGGCVTLRLNMVGFTGTVKVQAADNYQSPWYNVSDSTQYLNKTGQVYLNVLGYYPLLRLAFNKSIGTGATANATVINGVVTTINVTNGGNGYIAPPHVSILGDGAGAIAEAEISGNTVSNITVINGGSGYVPITQSNTGYQAPVFLSTGYIADILYR